MIPMIEMVGGNQQRKAKVEKMRRRSWRNWARIADFVSVPGQNQEDGMIATRIEPERRITIKTNLLNERIEEDL